MHKLISRLGAAVALTALIVSPAVAQDMIWFNPFTDPDPYYWNPDEQQQQQQQAAKVQQPGPKPKPVNLLDIATTMHSTLKDMPQMKITGLWSGDLSFKIGNADGRNYLVAPNGALKLLPLKVDVDAITVSEDSPNLAELKKQQMHPQGKNSSRNKGSADRNPYNVLSNYDRKDPRFDVGQPGLLTPTIVSSQTKYINGKEVVLSGAVISELKPTVAPAVASRTMTQAAVIARKSTRRDYSFRFRRKRRP